MQPCLNLADWIERYTPSAESPKARFMGSKRLTELHPDQLTTDTRQIQAGSVFVPLTGEKFDGHDFLVQAFEQGAALAFCSHSYYQQHQSTLTELALICVDDTLRAYQDLARSWHRLLGTPVIAITGSSGKTSSKEILYQVLKPFYQVHRTEANFNNQIGVPKTLLGLRPEHQLCIIEMGMRGLGQIQELCEIAEPDYGMITNVGPVHVSELGSIENVARAKWELADWLENHQGTLAINHDNPWLAQKAKGFRARLLCCGTHPQDELQLLASQSQNQGQLIDYRAGQDYSIWLDLEGEHQALNLLCCLGILQALGQDLQQLRQIEVPRLFGRQQRLELADGRVLINDAYNANPDSMRAALKVLAQAPAPRLAVLGKMAELGPEALKYHQQLGALCETLGLEGVYVLGPEARGILDGLQQVPGYYYEQAAELTEALKQRWQAGQTLLFKASRSASLEEVVTPLAHYFAKLAD